jgi:curved DNA-binding protein CbpA
LVLLALKRVVYALALARQLDFGVPGVEPVGLEEAPSSTRMPVFRPQPSGGREAKPSFSPRQIVPSQREPHAGATSAPPAELTPGLLALKQELEERAAAEGQNYYEVLGVPTDSPPANVQAAFFKLAKVWHPDKLPPGLEDVRDQCTKLFTRMSEAHQVLADVQRRKEYDELLAGGGGSAEEQEQVQQVLRAAAAFQRAEVLLKKKDIEGAEREALEAMHADPSQVQYKVLYAWACAHKPRETYDDLVVMLNEVLQAEPGNQDALWYRGQLHKRAGRPNRALRDFKTLLDLNPKHLDALREMRLHDMRKSDHKEEKGLLGKWFKR